MKKLDDNMLNTPAKTNQIRTCILSKKEDDKDKLLRFVLTPDNIVVPDFKKKLGGKGIYVSNSKTALTQAIQKKSFGKKAKVDESLVQIVEDILKAQSLNFLNLARKANILTFGFEKVREKLKKEKVAFLIQGINASADGSNKIKSVAGNVEILKLWTIEELDEALNKVNTVHIALIKSEMANKVYAHLKKWQDFINS